MQVLTTALSYPFHSSFHQARAPSWRRLHGRHHEWARTEARAHNGVETVQNSYVDAGIQVAINILVQNLSPWGLGCKHPLSRVLHNLLVTYLLTEAHSGYDLPFQSHRIFPVRALLGLPHHVLQHVTAACKCSPRRHPSPQGVFGGSPRHEEHHQSGDVCFHQFFMYLDDLRGRGPRAVAPSRAQTLSLEAIEPYASPSAVAVGVGGVERVGREPMAAGVSDERGNHTQSACTQHARSMAAEPAMGPRSLPLNEIIRRTGRRAAAARRHS